MVDAPTIPGLQTGGFAAAGDTIASLANVFSILVMVLAVIGVTMLLFWLLNKKILRYNTPVILKFEVGDGIKAERDKMIISNHDGVRKVEFKRNSKLVANVPNDKCAYFITQGMKTVKTYNGFVRDNQVTWEWPKPQTRINLIDDEGKVIDTVEQFVTMPANMVEFQVAETRRNDELRSKKKWWQDPVVLSYAAMGFMVIALIFIYLLYKSIPDQLNAYISIARDAVLKCGGVQIQ